MKRTISVRAAATGAAAALAFTGLGMSAAFAADGDPIPNEAVSSIVDDPNASLTIHKFTPTTSGDVTGKNNGMKLGDDELTALGAKKIEGVTFKIRKINELDVKKNADWVKANELSKTFATAKTEATITNAGYTLGDDKGGATGADGSFKTTAPLPVGFYFVEEVKPTGDVKVDGETTPGSSLVTSDPFIISVPLTNPTDKNAWVYDIHAYPKNSLTEITKAVKDSETPGTGNSTNGDSTIAYTINTGLPIGVTEYKSYNVIDPLDEKLEYIPNQDVVKLVAKDGSDIATPALTRGTDYEIISAAGPDIASTADITEKTYVTLRFKADGLAKLIAARDANPGAKVSWELKVKVLDTTGKTDITNQAFLIPPNNPDNVWDPNTPTDTPPGTPSNKVVSKYGKVTVKKVDETGTAGEKMNGAEFELYTCDAAGTLSGNKIVVDNVDKWTTAGSDSSFVIDGLQLNDFKNNSTEKDGQIPWKDQSFYCLKEVKAPAGYELLPNPIKFQLLQGDPDYSKSFDVKNIPSNGGFELPVTGGQGIALLVTAGGLLVAGSVAYTVAASRKRKQQA